MAWVMLGAAGIFEVVWATFMKLSEGFTKLGWTRIGALGSVIVGIVFFKEPVTAARIFFATLLLAGIVGLKLTAA